MEDVTVFRHSICHASSLSGVVTRIYNGKAPAIGSLRSTAVVVLETSRPRQHLASILFLAVTGTVVASVWTHSDINC
jgi:hypothetical protein